MKIKTKFYGEIEVSENELIMFKKPLLGFEKEQRFALIPALDEVSPFLMLQSTEDINLAFYLISPWMVDEDYEFNLTNEQVELLGVEQPEDLNVLTLITISSDIEKMTTNLLAPIVVNMKNQQAMQIVLQQTDYTTKHPILKAEAA